MVTIIEPRSVGTSRNTRRSSRRPYIGLRVCGFVLAAVAMAVLGGCYTAKIPVRPAVSVPPLLSEPDVELIILFDLANQPLPPEFTNGERIADNALQAAFGWRYQTAQPPRAVWFPESVEPGVIYAGYERRNHYLRAAIRYTQSSVSISIVESRNLYQSGDRIHKNAIAWVDQLEGRVRRALGAAATAKRLAVDARATR